MCSKQNQACEMGMEVTPFYSPEAPARSEPPPSTPSLQDLFPNIHVEVSPNYCSQQGGEIYRDPYYKRNPNLGRRIDSNLGQSPCELKPQPCSAIKTLNPQILLIERQPQILNQVLSTFCCCKGFWFKGLG